VPRLSSSGVCYPMNSVPVLIGERGADNRDLRNATNKKRAFRERWAMTPLATRKLAR